VAIFLEGLGEVFLREVVLDPFLVGELPAFLTTDIFLVGLSL
jgi:hypothetical protein